MKKLRILVALIALVALAGGAGNQAVRADAYLESKSVSGYWASQEEYRARMLSVNGDDLPMSPWMMHVCNSAGVEFWGWENWEDGTAVFKFYVPEGVERFTVYSDEQGSCPQAMGGESREGRLTAVPR